jgi:hypothetical protein
MLDAHLTPGCEQEHNAYCGRHGTCEQAAKQASWGAWYLTMGHAGFNSPANNAQGYETRAKAMAAYRHYSNKRKAAR